MKKKFYLVYATQLNFVNGDIVAKKKIVTLKIKLSLLA